MEDIRGLCEHRVAILPEHRDYLERENEQLRAELEDMAKSLEATSRQLEGCESQLGQYQDEVDALANDLRVCRTTNAATAAELDKARNVVDEQAQLLAEREDQINHLRRCEAANATTSKSLRDAKQEMITKTSQLLVLKGEKSRREAAHSQERALRTRDIETWGATTSSWSSNSALERAMFVLDEFNMKTFSDRSPLTFSSIPWPVLGDIQRLFPSDMKCEEVEMFFTFGRRRLTKAQYREMCEKMRTNLHPDQWRKRQILETVLDDEERDALEAAWNRVWRCAENFV